MSQEPRTQQMHKLTYLLLVLIALALGFFWLKAHDATVRAEARAQSTADSVDYLLEQLDSAYLEQDSLRTVFVDSMRVLEGQSTIYRARTVTLDSRADSLLAVLDTQLGRDSIQDSTKVAIVNAVDVLQDQVWTCNQALGNCESRVSLLNNQLTEETILLRQARFNVRQFAELYRDELTKRRHKLISVGVTLGLGATMSGGVVYAGPTVAIGLTFNLFTFGG